MILGGNGTHKTANLLRAEGVNVVTLPKTIDNDLWGTDMTFGFQSAVDIAANVIDCIRTTATSHGRVFIVEVMGHKVGWLTLHAGIAAGADIVLLPEIPYDIEKVGSAIERRRKQGKPFSILAVAEGALSKREAKMSKRNSPPPGRRRGFPPLPTAWYRNWSPMWAENPGYACRAISNGAALPVPMTGCSPPCWGPPPPA